LVRPGDVLTIPTIDRKGIELHPQPGPHWIHVCTGRESLIDLATALEVPLIDLYRGNARILREGALAAGLRVWGGVHAPYVWVACPEGLTSWGFFDRLLDEAAVVVTPGATAYLLTDRFGVLIVLSVAIGTLTSLAGAYLSYFLNGATGGVIVLLMTGVFLVAFVFAPRHGLLAARAKARAALERGPQA
jgi:hypothetical protein